MNCRRQIELNVGKISFPKTKTKTGPIESKSSEFDKYPFYIRCLNFSVLNIFSFTYTHVMCTVIVFNEEGAETDFVCFSFLFVCFKKAL